MITFQEAEEGIERPVVYRPEGAPAEHGVITEVRPVYREGLDKPWGYVMVRYQGDTVSKATAPEMLDFEEQAPR